MVPLRFWRPSTIAHAIIVLGALLRLWAGATEGLANDEAYYWCWSRHLDYWYYDQGPMIAWCLRATTSLFGDTLVGVRLCPVLLGAGTLWFLHDFTLRTFGPRPALWTVILASTAPLMSVGAAVATYDAPQVLFWAMALWSFERAVSGSIPAWYATGGLCFLGILSKVPMVFLPLGVLLACFVHAPWRKWLRTPHPWIAGAIAFSALGAMVLWNARHDQLYVLHTANLGRRTMSASPGRWLLDFVAGQALALGPGLLAAECVALSAVWRSRARSLSAWPAVLWAFVVPMLGVCLVNSVRSKVEINWPVSAHIAGLAVAGAWASERWDRGWRIGLGALLTPSILIQCFAWTPGVMATIGIRIPSRTVSKLTENRGWSQLARRLAAERAEMQRTNGRKPLLASTNYKATSVLSFLDPDRIEATCLFPGTRRNQFLLWPSARGVVGADYLVAVDHDPTGFLPYFRRWFGECSEPIPLPIVDPAFDGPIKTWYLVRCRDFRGYSPDQTAVGY